MADELYLFGQAAFEESVEALLAFRGRKGAGGHEPPAVSHRESIRVHVLIVDTAVNLTTTSTTVTTSTGTGTTTTPAPTTTVTTTTGTGTTSSTTATTTTTRPNSKIYPGKIILRNTNSEKDDEAWYDTGLECWVEEINNVPLTVGRRYSGDLMEEWNERWLVTVSVTSGSGGGTPGTCDLPESAEQLAGLSDKDHTYEYNVTNWTVDGVLQIQLSEPCCYVQITRRGCSDDGTHIVSKKFVVHHSYQIEVSAGPTVDGGTGGASWMDSRIDACAGMIEI